MPEGFDKEKWGIRHIDLMPRKGRTVIIYGKAGRGKTSLLNTLKGKILLINVDCGEQVLDSKNPDNEFDICCLVSKNLTNPSDSIAKLQAFVHELKKPDKLPWDYIVVDNITEMQDTKLVASLSSTTRKSSIIYPDQKAYGETGFAVLQVLKDMRNLTYKGVDVIYIAWEKTDKIEDFGGEIQSEKSPMLIGQTQAKVDGLVDFVGALRVDKKGNRYLQFDADYKYSAKKREEPGRNLPSIVQCPKDSKTTLQNFFDLVHGRKQDGI